MGPSGIKAFLENLGITVQWFDHEPVFTCEESAKLPPMPGADTKNLFLAEEKGPRRFLVVVGHETRADLKQLRGLLGVKNLTFGNADDLLAMLGVTPGSVTLLGLACDTGHRVEVVLDEPLWAAESLRCHPLTNAASVVIAHGDVEKFLAATGHTPRVLPVPRRS